MARTCEFRFGAPSWGTGGPEFKSRRSDQKILANQIFGVDRASIETRKKPEQGQIRVICRQLSLENHQSYSPPVRYAEGPARTEDRLRGGASITPPAERD